MNACRAEHLSRRALSRLLEASQAEGFAFMVRLADELERGCYLKPGAALFAAWEAAHLLGVVGLTPDPYLREPQSYQPNVGRVRHLYVAPYARRAGVGRALLAALTNEPRRHYQVLRLRTDNPAAATFYKALGFAETSEPDATHRRLL